MGYSNLNHYDYVSFSDGLYHLPLLDEKNLGELEGKSCTLDNITKERLENIRNILIKSKTSIDELKKLDTYNLEQLQTALNDRMSSQLDNIFKLYTLTEPNYMNICSEFDNKPPKKPKKKLKQSKIKGNGKIIKYSLRKKQKIKRIKEFIKEECNALSNDDQDSDSKDDIKSEEINEMDVDTLSTNSKSKSKTISNSSSIISIKAPNKAKKLLKKDNILSNKQIKAFLDGKTQLLNDGFKDGMFIYIHIYMCCTFTYHISKYSKQHTIYIHIYVYIILYNIAAMLFCNKKGSRCLSCIVNGNGKGNQPFVNKGSYAYQYKKLKRHLDSNKHVKSLSIFNTILKIEDKFELIKKITTKEEIELMDIKLNDCDLTEYGMYYHINCVLIYVLCVNVLCKFVYQFTLNDNIYIHYT